jgi:hypothetical protein
MDSIAVWVWLAALFFAAIIIGILAGTVFYLVSRK